MTKPEFRNGGPLWPFVIRPSSFGFRHWAFALNASLLFGAAATDRLTFVAIPFLLLFVALIACYLPARRAARLDPKTALAQS